MSEFLLGLSGSELLVALLKQRPILCKDVSV